MDHLTNQALGALLPAELNDFIQAHVLHPHSVVQHAVRQANVVLNNIYKTMIPVIEPFFDRLLDAINENQGTTGLLLVVAVITAVLVVMNWIRRIMMWWTRMVAKLSFYAILALLLAAVWQRGLTTTARDLVVFGSKLAGYGAALKDVWMEEYDRYESQSAGTGAGRSGHR